MDDGEKLEPDHVVKADEQGWGSHPATCGCETCQELREAWAKQQEPVIGQLDDQDGEDTDLWQETGGEG